MTTLYETISSRSQKNNLAIDLLVVLAGSLLMAIAAKITIPFYPVPLTTQTLVAIGLGLALGPARAAAAVLAYLAQGAAGLPVFAGAPANGLGLAYMAGPTGGYLIGFVFQSLAAGFLARLGWGRSPVTAVGAGLIAAAAIYPTGLLWLGVVIGFDKPLLALGLFPFVLGDLAKACLAALIFPAAWSMLARNKG
ncbi:biotin transporter BioY [Hoeflea sp. G2-23]|uniref:Biotin transporter n=1 Tax=Hoeflea algicola TaxID=2983763 RepID=A0ABT3Z566_9HYPH|nr:biotin transporter BioY [Hoeflea algicola]MCY0146849.1 biotin transporter BioY [Hoeflea algicola]